MSTASAEVVAASGLTATTLFTYLIVPALVLWVVYYRMSRRRLYELAAKLPGPEGLPLVGKGLEFIGSPHDIYTRVNKLGLEWEDKPVVKVWVGPRLLVFLKDPRDVEIILSSHVHIDKSPEYRFFKPWLGNGLLISTGEKWRAHRKLIAPTFHLNVLKSFLDLFNQNSRAVVLERTVPNSRLSWSTPEILLETAMGVNKKTQNQSGFEYAMAVMKMCHILHIR
ncbi:cytochrome P450 4g15-like [Diaphorina citri]|uniref:Cytochrome P450 4g15-like n=1 Tax=Diaphorina citri TaxID=121845 RepID=A0A1S3D5H4_DIACI|nr:cytochrome P450 4g15-like [Diaphorina citri]